MKKPLLLTVISLFLITINYAQYDSTRVNKLNGNLKESLLLKSKKQNTTAWVLLGGGIALNALSFAFHPEESDDFSTGFDKAFISAGLLIVGTAAMISSIPVFIVSAKNKRKANLIVNAGKVELSPGLKTSEWQLKAGMAFHF